MASAQGSPSLPTPDVKAEAPKAQVAKDASIFWSSVSKRESLRPMTRYLSIPEYYCIDLITIVILSPE